MICLKKNLFGCVKTLLDYAKHSDDIMAKKDEHIEKLNVCCHDFKSLYEEAKPKAKSRTRTKKTTE